MGLSLVDWLNTFLLIVLTIAFALGLRRVFPVGEQNEDDTSGD